MDYGLCHLCGHPVTAGASFINTGPTDAADTAKPRSQRWVPLDEDIHGWSPFILSHPTCFADAEGVPALVALVNESHRMMRRHLQSRG